MTIAGSDFSVGSRYGFPFSGDADFELLPGLGSLFADLCVFGAQTLTGLSVLESGASFDFDGITGSALLSGDGFFLLTYADGRPGGSAALADNWKDTVSAWPVGDYELGLSLAPSAFIPVPTNGLRYIEADGVKFYGDVYLIAECGLMLNYADGALRFDAIGDSRAVERNCSSAGVFTVPTLIKTINNVAPAADQLFTFVRSTLQAVDPALRIYPSGNSIILERL